MAASDIRGFTLVEVMFALGLFALAALAGVVATSQHLANLTQLQNKTFAQYAAANALARLSLEYPPVDKRTGVELIADQEWMWESQVSETATDKVYYITVRVYAGEIDVKRSPEVIMSRYLGPLSERPSEVERGEDTP